MSAESLIDSHCHLDFPDFDIDRESVICNARTLGVQHIVIPGVRARTWDKLHVLCETYSCLSYALGLHPYFLSEHVDNDVHRLKEQLSNGNAVAVGEIGLDFFDKELDQKKQISLCSEQLELADEYRLPVILHVRKAHDDMLKLLAEHQFGGIVHAFSGGMEHARKYLDLGFKLGFGGLVSFPHSRKLHNLVRQLPLDGIALETDSPDMSGYGYRGQRNSPEYLPDYFHAIAQLRSEQQDCVAEQSSLNVIQTLNLPVDRRS